MTRSKSWKAGRQQPCGLELLPSLDSLISLTHQATKVGLTALANWRNAYVSMRTLERTKLPTCEVQGISIILSRMPLAKVFRIFCKSAYTSSTYALASLSVNSGAVAIVVAGARAQVEPSWKGRVFVVAHHDTRTQNNGPDARAKRHTEMLGCRSARQP